MAKTLRETREERGGVGIRRLSKGAPVAPRTIYQIERGQSTPTPDTIRKISRYLNVDPMEVSEFRDALAAQGLDALPEEPQPETPFADVFAEEEEPEPVGPQDRGRRIANLVYDMSALPREDVDAAYRLVFREEPPI